jgi:hypothetical protein
MMNHSAWVKAQISKWPHVVDVRHLSQPKQFQGDHVSRCAWLESQVGPRYKSWNYPTEGVYVFKCEQDLMQFTLTWC